MGIGISIFLIAVGAVLRFALRVVAHGVNLQTVGVILMVVGAVGLAVALLVAGVGSGRRVTRRESVEEGYQDPANPARRVVRRRDTYVG